MWTERGYDHEVGPQKASLSLGFVSTRSTGVRTIASIGRLGAGRTQRVILQVTGSVFLTLTETLTDDGD
jgi:hypothetical protein